MTNTKSFAALELDILSKSATDPHDRPLIEPFKEEILALCEKFGQSGQSGGSAPYVAGAIVDALKKLLMQRPICPITGEDWEWMNVSKYGAKNEKEVVWQNLRCSTVFKTIDGKAYYLDAIAWKTQTGQTWSGPAFLNTPDSSEKILSRQYIKSFPFRPKTFYIDVIEKEVAKDDFGFLIKDEKQLEKVFVYYDKMIIK